ncbi:hypothetical protein [Streptomyces sp. NRRL S-813]|uniref:hypothetical protein n=1 Tax=Streptomyces sp. NRRL S-813 TaxID=1463919 RepID=UPI000ADC41C4|nr:hypothetical protein [Streptomyces sp. NRRL S-813]
MRITRTLFVSAAIATAVAFSAPGAGAVELTALGHSPGHTPVSSTSYGGDSDDGDKPHGGVHAGGGALAMKGTDHGGGRGDDGGRGDEGGRGGDEGGRW